MLRRIKLSYDPNNTAWNRDGTAYGQKIMQSQGWIPGSILGATSANSNAGAHSHFSYTGIKRRNGNSGLGRSTQNNYDESHALDAFQEVLGRLNGRPEVRCAAATTQSRDLKTVSFLEGRWPILKFVSGGLLTDYKSKDLKEQPQKPPSSPIAQVVTTSDVPADEEVDARMNEIHQRKSVKSQSSDFQESLPRSSRSAASDNREIRGDAEAGGIKKRKKRKRAIEKPSNDEIVQQSQAEETIEEHLAPAVEDQTTPEAGNSLSSRHAVRMRYIRHKKMAMMDRKALNEVSPIFRIRNRTQDY